MMRAPFVLTLGVLLLGVGCSDDEPAPPTRVTARQITDVADLIGGTDPMGGLGDWYIANDVVEAIIDDVGNPNHLAPSGGNLLDFAHIGRDDDQFNQMFQIFMVTQDLPLRYSSIEASAVGDVATLTVRGKVFAANPDPTMSPLTPAVANGLDVTTVYELRHGDPKLYVKTTLVNNSGGPVGGGFGFPISDVILWGSRGVVPFAPYVGRGFAHPILDVRNPIGAFGAYLYIGARSDVEPHVSYGMLSTTATRGRISGVNNTTVSALGLDPIAGDLPAGGTVEFSRVVLIGADNTVDSIASQAFQVQSEANPAEVAGVGTLTGTVTGLVAGREAQVIASESGLFGTTPTNATRARSPDGNFSLSLPPGNYLVDVIVGSAPPTTVGPFTVTAGASASAGDLPAPGMGTLNYTILSDGMAKPARITLKGVGMTPDPLLGPLYSSFVSRNVAYALDGTGTLAVEPGTYDVYASRGLEYTLATQQVTVTPGSTENLTFNIQNVIDTTGYVSVDAHVHSGASFDASVGFEARMLAMAGEGVEVVISTDHDYIADFQPAVEALGLNGEIATIIGIESTGSVPTPNFPFTIGHSNAWPMTIDPTLPRAGAVPDEDVEPSVVFERLRAITSGTPVVQLNHGRASAQGTISLGYFTNFDFEPDKAIPPMDDGGVNSFLVRETPGGTKNLDFDTMEILNGASWSSVPTDQQNRDDWLSLLKQGYLKTGMANSDTHQINPEIAGWPRNYVRYAPDTPAGLDVETLDQAILAMQSVGTRGPMITATVMGSTVGDEVDVGAPGTVTVNIQVEAAPWIPIDEVRVLLNGDVVCLIDAMGATAQAAATTCPAGLMNPPNPFGSGGVLRYDAAVDINVTTDSFIIVEAGAALPVAADLLDNDGVLDTWDTDGDGDVMDEMPGARPPFAAPALPDAIVPGLLPWGFTNPIRIDIGADGWSAPGL